MKEMLLALKKAVDEALAADPSTEEIPLAEFPSHVVKSLEAILGDTDVERAARRLATAPGRARRGVHARQAGR